ncbi:MAG: hypothetical protein QOH71_4309 [Blastocatellia bacterium]|nr:hypothetical protein [Blastocatellia bacterium]
MSAVRHSMFIARLQLRDPTSPFMGDRNISLLKELNEPGTIAFYKHFAATRLNQKR